MRLIDADALEYQMLYKENWLKGTGSEAQAIWKKDIDSQPTIDAVPVVRCRECRYAREPNRMDRDERLACEGVLGCCVGFDHVYPSSDDGLIFVDGIGFCSYGERKDGDGDG